MPEFTKTELRDCALRELNMRRHVYPRWVTAKRMSQAKADKELAMMETIHDLFTEMIEQEKLL